MSFFNKKELKKIIATIVFPHLRSSYSQSGEDIIISDLFTRLRITHPSYLDIGANDPVALSNTYRLYKRGSQGVCVEPNPVLFEKLKQKRPRDISLNVGVAFNSEREATYYMFESRLNGLNTFSKAEAEFWEQTGNEEIGRHKVEKAVKMELVPVNEIMARYFSPHPNFVSIDVEGLDLEILQTINFDQFKPEVFCIETLGYLADNREIKKKEIFEFFQNRGYFVYADSYINTVFCRNDALVNFQQHS